MMERVTNNFPQRRHPTHMPPVERHNQPIVIMVTVCTFNRKSVLASSEMRNMLIESWQQAFDWRVGFYMIMPDHVHLFCSPGKIPMGSLRKWVGYWKRLVSVRKKNLIPLWQQNFWDTQMRNSDHYREKLYYMRQNPVRKELVSVLEEWPYAGELHRIVW